MLFKQEKMDNLAVGASPTLSKPYLSKHQILGSFFGQTKFTSLFNILARVFSLSWLCHSLPFHKGESQTSTAAALGSWNICETFWGGFTP